MRRRLPTTSWSWHIPGMRHLCCVVLLGACVSSTGCVARFSGELDGAPLPPFSTTALAIFEGAGGQARLFGTALPGDSCNDVVTVVETARAFADSISTDNFNSRGETLATTLNTIQPEDEWRFTVGINATTGLDSLAEAVVDLDSNDTDIFVGLQLCKSDGEAELRDGFLDERQDCYRAVDGDLELARNEEDGSVRLLAVEPLTFLNDNGSEDGDIAFDITLSTCSPWIDTLSPTAAPANVCFQQCVENGGWAPTCATNCRFGGEGEGEGEFEGEGEGEGE